MIIVSSYLFHIFSPCINSCILKILSEEKGRIDSMAEGLEEESKKSLQMEAELEKQLADFDTERQQMRGQLTKKEERYMSYASFLLVEKTKKMKDIYD